MKFTKFTQFTKLAILILIAGMLISAGGCSTVISQASFRGETICSGQSGDSIVERIGQPDRTAQLEFHWFWGWRFTPEAMADQIDPWTVITGYEVMGGHIVEWMYKDDAKSLIMWLNTGTVGRMWLVDSCELNQ